MKKRIWYDGLGKKMKRGTYNQNEIEWIKNNCEHEFEKRNTEVFFFGGGYYHKMRKCEKCGRYTSSDMATTHPTGNHRFTILTKNGFCKCEDCGLQMALRPTMYIGKEVI